MGEGESKIVRNCVTSFIKDPVIVITVIDNHETYKLSEIVRNFLFLNLRVRISLKTEPSQITRDNCTAKKSICNKNQSFSVKREKKICKQKCSWK